MTKPVRTTWGGSSGSEGVVSHVDTGEAIMSVRWKVNRQNYRGTKGFMKMMMTVRSNEVDRN